MRKKANTSAAMRTLEASKHCERKRLQDLPKPSVIQNKKKQARKLACRSGRQDN